MTDLTTAITAAANLSDLRDAMNAMGDEINAAQSGEEDASDLINTYAAAVERSPTFGGDEPDDTTGVWSWDATHLLIGEGWGGAQLIERD